MGRKQHKDISSLLHAKWSHRGHIILKGDCMWSPETILKDLHNDIEVKFHPLADDSITWIFSNTNGRTCYVTSYDTLWCKGLCVLCLWEGIHLADQFEETCDTAHWWETFPLFCFILCILFYLLSIWIWVTEVFFALAQCPTAVCCHILFFAVEQCPTATLSGYTYHTPWTETVYTYQHYSYLIYSV
jgi:hypothetical protein